MCQPSKTVRSLLSYGLPDFGGLAWSDYDARARLLKMIQSTLEMHEPRLRNIRVTFPPDLEDHPDRTLRFRIEAILRVEPMTGPVAFDAQQDQSLSRFQVRRADN
jgi:type VI secretion system protein ImpF